MNILGVSAAASTYNTQQTKTFGTGYTFAQIMEQSQKSKTTNAAASSTSVRAGLDAETTMYLDKYAEIYNKYAKQYGDGFEIVKGLYGDGSASDAEESKHAEARGAFYTELYEAGIPGAGRLVMADEVDLNTVNFINPTDEYWKSSYKTGISTLFYAEKYGLAGLSPEEQCQAVFSKLKTSTVEEMSGAAQLLYNIGAISAYEQREIQKYTSIYASQTVGLSAFRSELIAAQRDISIDWSGMLEELKGNENGKDIYELLSKAWDTQEDDEEGLKLKAILRKVDAQQDAIHEAIELANKKRRELELLDRAAAEGARLRIMFGLDNGLDVDAADMIQDTAESVMPVI